MASTFDLILNSLLTLYRQYPSARRYTFVLAGILITLATATLLYISVVRPELRTDQSMGPIVGVLAISFVALTIAGLSLITDRVGGSGIDSELAPIRRERVELQERLSEKSEPDLFDAVQLNLNQLSEYYTINKSQARYTFRASLFAVIVGLLTIIVGVWLFYLRAEPNANLTYLTVVSGILLEFIGGAYFYLHNKSLAQLNFFFARLVTIQDTMLSIKLCEVIGEQDRRDRVLERLIFAIVSRDVKLPLDVEPGSLRAARTRTKSKSVSEAAGKADGGAEAKGTG